MRKRREQTDTKYLLLLDQKISKEIPSKMGYLLPFSVLIMQAFL